MTYSAPLKATLQLVINEEVNGVKRPRNIIEKEVYLGELNPRISGASSITNVTAGAYADIPLFAFHLLEYFDVDFELDCKAASPPTRSAVHSW